jgi:hypothetical protein
MNATDDITVRLDDDGWAFIGQRWNDGPNESVVLRPEERNRTALALLGPLSDDLIDNIALAVLDHVDCDTGRYDHDGLRARLTAVLGGETS